MMLIHVLFSFLQACVAFVANRRNSIARYSGSVETKDVSKFVK